MSRTFQGQWLTDILESAPSFAFLALLRSNVDLQTAGWIGAALAGAILLIFPLCKVRFNPILLGINTHLLLVTPVIVTVFHLGAPELGTMLTHHSYNGVLVTIFMVGLALTLFSREGFIGQNGLSYSTTLKYSAILLIASLAAIAWSFYSDGPLLAVALPIIALFALRRLLVARSIDGAKITGITAVGGGAAITYDSEFDPC